MKQSLIVFFGILLNLYSFSQGRVNESRQTSGYHFYQAFDKTTNTIIQGIGVPVDEGFKFTIEDDQTLREHYVIYFWDVDSTEPEFHTLNYNAAGAPLFFVISKSDLDSWSNKLYARLAPSFGAMTMPFKYRPQSGKFEKTFNMGFTGGFTFYPGRLGAHRFSVLLGIAASSATLDKYNTDPIAEIKDPTDRAAVTFSANLVYQWENLQLATSGGLDNILDNEIAKWRYQGKGWLSLGIGVALFTANSDPKVVK